MFPPSSTRPSMCSIRISRKKSALFRPDSLSPTWWSCHATDVGLHRQRRCRNGLGGGREARKNYQGHSCRRSRAAHLDVAGRTLGLHCRPEASPPRSNRYFDQRDLQLDRSARRRIRHAPTLDGKWLLVTMQTANQVAVVDLAQMKVARTIPVAADPVQILARPGCGLRLLHGRRKSRRASTWKTGR